MKKYRFFLPIPLMAMLIMLSGCGKEAAFETENAETSVSEIEQGNSAMATGEDSGSILQSNILTEPPVLELQDILSGSYAPIIIENSGNYEWNYQDGDMMSGGIACGAAPLDTAREAKRFDLPNYDKRTETGVAYSVSVVVTPTSLTVNEYDTTDIGNMDAQVLSSEQYESDFMLWLQPNRVYEITAEWDEKNLPVNGFYGEASYVFVTGE